MKTRVIMYLSLLGIGLILFMQAYLVYTNYKQARSYLTHESDAVIDEAFLTELNQRNTFYKHLSGEDTLKTPPPRTIQNSTQYNMSEIKAYRNNLTLFTTLILNRFVSKTVPMNLHNLDSITGTILKAKNIQSKYVVRVIDCKTGKVKEQSARQPALSVFQIPSQIQDVDLDKKISLQLVLINPFAIIFKRMGILLASSVLVALFCFYGLWFLFRTQARQKILMKVKNDFFGHTAHELKRPVAQLHLALEALSRPGIDENKAKKERYLAISKEATKDMSEKITMIMTLSMAEEGVFNLNYSDFNLLEEVRKLKEQFSAITEKDISIEIENADADIQIKADKEHLRQCIANLIDNAIKYSGMSVKILIRINRMKDLLRLSVQDNGIGINPEKLSSVFEKYTRLNTASGSPSGFGIGLSYVKTVVEKHAGHIEVQSEPGKGSEFILSLPV